jgi:hypothetical protein
MVNAFNSMLRRIIFQKLCAINGDIIQLIPFVHAFYAFESPMFYIHRNHEGEVMIIPCTMETHQNDPLKSALFTLTHFATLHSTASHFPSCLFPYIVDDIHIIGPPSIISFAYEHSKLNYMGWVFLSNLKNVQHGLPLVCRLALVPHPCLTPH